jgi:hypothetical protein
MIGACLSALLQRSVAILRVTHVYHYNAEPRR